MGIVNQYIYINKENSGEAGMSRFYRHKQQMGI